HSSSQSRGRGSERFDTCRRSQRITGSPSPAKYWQWMLPVGERKPSCAEAVTPVDANTMVAAAATNNRCKSHLLLKHRSCLPLPAFHDRTLSERCSRNPCLMRPLAGAFLAFLAGVIVAYIVVVAIGHALLQGASDPGGRLAIRVMFQIGPLCALAAGIVAAI